MKELIEYAKSYIGVPYIWATFDCSEFAQEILAFAGIDPTGDQTAQGLYNHFVVHGKASVSGPGALVFYGKSVREITHISMMISIHQIIEAGGGGSKTIDLQSAIAQKAKIRVRPRNHRKDIVAVVMPNYPDWLTK